MAAKNENKTVPKSIDPQEFIQKQEGGRQEDCQTLLTFFEEITGEKGRMWGDSIVGFGQYHYVYDSGREGDFFHVGFSPRKQNLSIYFIGGFGNDKIMHRLGKYKTGKSCLYVKQLSDVDLKVLEELAHDSISKIKKKYPD